MIRARLLAVLLAAALPLGGCSIWDTYFGTHKTPLPGERIAVMKLDRTLTADPTLADVPVKLPKPFENPDWPQAGGNSAHVMHHLALGADPRPSYTVSIGSSAGKYEQLLDNPVVASGRVFTIDRDETVSAYDAASGQRLWYVDLTPDDEDDGLFGGGLAVQGNRLYVTTPFAFVYALDIDSGKKLWESKMPGPMRAPPAVSDGRIFAITLDYEVVALAEDDGRRLWSYAGESEGAGLLGGTTPAVLGNTVISTDSSGNVFALRAETGKVLWSDNLAGAARGDSIATMADIRGRPVIDRDMVIAISNSGTLAAIDLRRGDRVWDKDVGGTQQPWIAGDYVFIVDNDNQVLCLNRADGRVKWVQALPAYENAEEMKDPIYWSGPLLAGDRLVVSGSSGHALALSPYTGEILGQIELPARSHLAPIVAGNTIYFLSDNAELMALR
ncbi:MAG: PQQ-binding-like beta-propeller repeat protein [Dongiaceae bacterium]